jgi:hypothetical protein
MNAEITTTRINTKWHGYIDGRPDIEETALSEEAARRKVEQIRDRLGSCTASTTRFGGRRCELIEGHRTARGERTEHRSGDASWRDGA